MADKLTKSKLMEFLKRLGDQAQTPGTCYITGGTSAVLVGWRDTTIDIDLKFDPEPRGVFEAIPKLKKDLGVNVELAAPDDFLPPVPDWRERSTPIGVFGKLQIAHYDFVSQALAKLSRGHARDLSDVREMIKRGIVHQAQIIEAFEKIRGQMIRYPSLDEEVLERAIKDFFLD